MLYCKRGRFTSIGVALDLVPIILIEFGRVDFIFSVIILIQFKK